MIAAKLSGCHEIEIWGDGEQTRSFMFIDDCLYGTRVLMASDIVDNIRSSEMVTINQLVDLAEEIAGSRSNATTTSTLQRDSRPEQRQYIDQKQARLGTFHPSSNRTQEDLRVDLRPNERWRIDSLI